MDRKPITYSLHAMTALRRRGLAPEWVEAAVHEPEWTEPEPADPRAERRFKVLRERDGRVVRVVVAETEKSTHIVTTFLDRRARQQNEVTARIRSRR